MNDWYDRKWWFYGILSKTVRKPFTYAGVKKYVADFSLTEHSHKFWQFFIVLEGEILLEYGGETKALSPGMVSIIPPGVPHNIRTETEYTQFGADLLPMQEYALVELLTENVRAPLEIEFREGLSKLKGIESLVNRTDRISYELLFARTEELLFHILQFLADIQKNPFQKELEQYLLGHLDGSASLKEAAAHLKFSLSHCERLCRRYYGCGVMALSQNIRAAAAVEMLTSTDCSVKEIGHRFGFHDSSHFSRFIKSMTGRTPGAHRGMNR